MNETRPIVRPEIYLLFRPRAEFSTAFHRAPIVVSHSLLESILHASQSPPIRRPLLLSASVKFSVLMDRTVRNGKFHQIWAVI